MRRLADAGPRDFYEGEIASSIDAAMRENSGFVRLSDLAAVRAPREAKPLRAAFLDGQAHTVGPPAGGVTLVELLNMYGALGMKHGAVGMERLDLDEPADLVLLARMIQRARRDRSQLARRLGAEDLGRASRLVSQEFAHDAVASLQREPAGGETTHLNVVDRFGNAIALTQSIERSFGSAEIAQDLGFLFNGYLRGFKVVNQRHPHYLRAGAPARSNAAPTLVRRGRAPWILIGSTGSERMVSGIFTTLLRLRDAHPFSAVAAPRLHCTPEGEILLEAERFPAGSAAALTAAGFTLRDVGAYSFSMGGLQLIVRAGEQWVGVGEPRRDGAACGP